MAHKTVVIFGYISALFLGVNGFNREIALDQGGAQSTITWRSCGGDALVTPLTLTNCERPTCTLKIYKGYLGKFSLIPKFNHTYLNLMVTSKSLFTGKIITLLDTNGYQTDSYIPGANLSLHFPLIHGNASQTNQTQDVHSITLTVGSKQIEVCRQFEVFLNSSVPNTNKHVGDNCWDLDSPCDFAHSLCGKNGDKSICKCDSLSVERNKTCGKIINLPCFHDGECLENGVCTNGYCQCQNGISHFKNQCSGAISLTTSVLLLGFLHFIVYSY